MDDNETDGDTGADVAVDVEVGDAPSTDAGAAAAPGESTFVDVGGLTLHVRRAGPANGPPVVLLHGFPEFWYGWRRQMAALADAGYRVLVPDGRGYNLSDRPASVAAYGLDSLARDVTGLLDAEGYDTAAVVGHDWGAVLGWWLAMESPDRVDRLAVLNGPHPGALGDALRRSWDQRLRSAYTVAAQLPAVPEALFRAGNYALLTRVLTATSRPGTFPPEALSRYRAAWRRPGALTGMLNWYRAAGRGLGAYRRRDEVTVPVLVLWGTADGALQPELAAASARLCANARVERVDATHWLQHERPAAVTDSLVAFLG
jgi:pimeloyl-ACP methyl ester carboxylesterase